MASSFETSSVLYASISIPDKIGAPHLLPLIVAQSLSEKVGFILPQFDSLPVSNGANKSLSINCKNRCPATVIISTVGFGASAANKLNCLP